MAVYIRHGLCTVAFLSNLGHCDCGQIFILVSERSEIAIDFR